jgi:hypothetical protein
MLGMQQWIGGAVAGILHELGDPNVVVGPTLGGAAGRLGFLMVTIERGCGVFGGAAALNSGPWGRGLESWLVTEGPHQGRCLGPRDRDRRRTRCGADRNE